MSRMSLSSLAIAVVALVMGGCATSSPSASQIDSSRDVAEMKERILELQEQAAMTMVEIDRLQAEVSSLQQRLAGGDTSPLPMATSDSVDVAVEMLAGDAAQEPISNTTEIIVEESDLVIDLPAEPQPEIVIDPVEGSASAQTPIPGAGTPLLEVEPAAQALYDRGYTLYHQGRYLDAEASFQRFLQAYPSTELSDNAQFWIGESRYARSDIQGAMAAFRELLQKYPEGNKVPDALIKEGDCLATLGDGDGARNRFQEVMRRFPDTGAAVMAEDRLAELDG